MKYDCQQNMCIFAATNFNFLFEDQSSHAIVDLNISIHKKELIIKLIDISFPQNYEMLRMQNDTECHCVSSSKLYETKGKASKSLDVDHDSTECKCPTDFDIMKDAEGCHCNCSKLDAACRLRYEGREGFTISDLRLVAF